MWLLCFTGRHLLQFDVILQLLNCVTCVDNQPGCSSCCNNRPKSYKQTDQSLRDWLVDRACNCALMCKCKVSKSVSVSFSEGLGLGLKAKSLGLFSVSDFKVSFTAISQGIEVI